MTIFRFWPIGLFIATVVLAIAASVITSTHRHAIERSQASANDITILKQQYEATLSKAPSASGTPAEPKIVIASPKVGRNCSTILGLQVCSPSVEFAKSEVTAPSAFQNSAIRAELNDKLSEINNESAAGREAMGKASRITPAYELVQTIMRPLISLIVLGAALYIVLSDGYKPEQEKWAFGTIGTVIGFWLPNINIT